jgi:MFS family permease
LAADARHQDSQSESVYALGVSAEPTQPNRLRAVTLILAAALTMMSGAAVTPALAEIRTAFADVENVKLLTQRILTIPAIVIVLGAPVAGWVVDRVGRRPTLVISMVLYVLAGTSGYYLHELSHLLLGRAFLGVAVAGTMTAVTTLAGDYFTGAQRRRFLALQGASMAAGGVVLIGTAGLLAAQSWRYPFLIYLLAVPLIPLVLAVLPEPDRAARQDGAQQGPVASAPVATLALIYFVAFFGMMIFYSLPTQLPFHVGTTLGGTGRETGLAIATASFFGVLSAGCSAPLKRLLSFPAIFALLFLLEACGYALIGRADSYATLYGGLVLFGLGFGLLMPNVNLWLLGAAPAHIRGTLAGLLTTSVFLGQFISPELFARILPNAGQAEVFVLGGWAAGIVGLLFAGYVVIWQRYRPGAAA